MKVHVEISRTEVVNGVGTIVTREVVMNESDVDAFEASLWGTHEWISDEWAYV